VGRQSSRADSTPNFVSCLHAGKISSYAFTCVTNCPLQPLLCRPPKDRDACCSMLVDPRQADGVVAYAPYYVAPAAALLCGWLWYGPALLLALPCVAILLLSAVQCRAHLPTPSVPPPPPQNGAQRGQLISMWARRSVPAALNSASGH